MAREKRTVQVNVMMTEMERACLDDIAQGWGMSISGAVRWMIGSQKLGGKAFALERESSAKEGQDGGGNHPGDGHSVAGSLQSSS